MPRILVAWPWLAFLPAAALFLLYLRGRGRLALGAGLAWALYAGYEFGMQRRWLCTGECNIRVDLLLIYPALLVVSLAAVVAAVRARGPSGGRGSTG